MISPPSVKDNPMIKLMVLLKFVINVNKELSIKKNPNFIISFAEKVSTKFHLSRFFIELFVLYPYRELIFLGGKRNITNPATININPTEKQILNKGFSHNELTM